MRNNFSKSHYQCLIEGLKAGMATSQIMKCISKQNFKVKHADNKICLVIEDADDALDSNLKTLTIFDDVMLEMQNKVEAYYTRERHNNINRFYVSRNYIKFSKNVQSLEF
jgi:hypothetical protein